MTYGHRPVMVEEVARLIDAGPGAVYIDATVGFGGHTERLAELAGPTGRVLGLDRDPLALKEAAARLEGLGSRVVLVRTCFARLHEALAALGPDQPRTVNGVLFDLGVSSAHLDLEDRGFSYHGTGPLDMRMDPSGDGPTAADLLADLDERELTRVFRDLGEERWAERIASFVVKTRRRGPLKTADQLVEVVKQAVPAAARRQGPHPARRVFQALRMAVNRELEEIEAALRQVPDLLSLGGRVVVIAYHSLEDRIVKTRFREEEKGCLCPPGLPECRCGGKPTLKVLTRKPIVPSEREVNENPRSRSAKLRAAERL